MTKRLVTVFGGSGFIGRYVVQRLARRGDFVRVAVRDPEAALYLKTQGVVGQVTPIGANLRMPESVEAAVAGADEVVNLVGILYESGASKFDPIQAEGPGVVGRAATATGVKRLVHVSAIGADSTSPAAYARSKAVGETNLRAAFPGAVILRPSVVFGPEDGFFNRFAQMAQFAPALPLIGGGATRFQPVFVEDVADAVLAGLERADAVGQTYELGGPRVYSFRELMELLLAEIQRKRFLVPLPFAVASLMGAVMERLPSPVITRDQVKLLKRDNVVAPDAKTLADLEIDATPVETILPAMMTHYRPGGRWHFKTARGGEQTGR